MKVKRILFYLPIVSLFLCGCTNTQNDKPTSLKATSDEVKLMLNTERNLNDIVTLQFEPKNVTNKNVTWSCIENEIFTLNNSFIKANKVGEGLVTATSVANTELKVDIKVSVYSQEEDFYYVSFKNKEGYEVSGLKNGYKENEKVSFTLKVLDDKKEVDKVTKDTITLEPIDINKYEFNMPKKDVEISVTLKDKIVSKDKVATSVSLDPTTLELEVNGQDKEIVANVLPAETTDKPNWSISQGEDVISITSDNNKVTVHPLKAGNAKVKVTYNSNVSAECSVNVKDNQTSVDKVATSVSLDPSSLELEVNGQDKEIMANVLPAETTDKPHWSISQGEDVISIMSDNNKVIVHPLKAGDAKVKVTYNSNVSAECSVKVKEKEAINLGTYDIVYDLGTRKTAKQIEDNSEIFATFKPKENTTNVINSVSKNEYIYGGGNGGRSETQWYSGNMLKFGTTSVNGSLTLELNAQVKNIKITGYISDTNCKIRVGDSASLDWNEIEEDKKTSLYAITSEQMNIAKKDTVEAHSVLTISLEFQATKSLKIATTNKKPLYITAIEFVS